MGQRFDKYSWPVVSQGLVFQALYRSRGYSSSPLTLLNLTDDMQEIVRTVLRSDEDMQAEIYSVVINGVTQFCVLKSTSRMSPNKELLYPASAQDHIGACTEEAVRAAALSPLQMAWRNINERFPMVVMPLFGLFLLVTGVWMSYSIFFSSTNPNEQILLIVTVPYAAMGLVAIIYPYMTGYRQRQKVREGLMRSLNSA